MHINALITRSVFTAVGPGSRSRTGAHEENMKLSEWFWKFWNRNVSSETNPVKAF